MFEVHTSPEIKEGTEVKPPERRDFTEIKPKGDLSLSDARSYFDNLFKEMSDKAKALEGSDAKTSEISENKPRTPETHGEWDGERGNSMWLPERDYVPPEKSRNPDKPYSNPDHLPMGEILDKYGIEGIQFKDGYPVFDPVAKATTEIGDFETGGQEAKNHNFESADKALAEQKGCTPEEVKTWRQDNNYTWHECEDKRTMQLVPNEVHANIPHNGGRSL